MMTSPRLISDESLSILQMFLYTTTQSNIYTVITEEWKEMYLEINTS